ncbi:hypothetical protein ACHAWX_001554 [Stephanocyclus meneghinianus]
MHSGLDQRADLSDVPSTTNNLKTKVARPTTKIVAITDISYAGIALHWHRRLIELGYSKEEAIVVAADDATLDYFHQHPDIKVEPILHPQSSGWPVANEASRRQTRRRRIFASRWIYVLHQLKNGYSVLLTDADNIFVRYMNMSEMEDSPYDVFHAYCYNFPVEFLSMGFVVCGGMMWLRGSTDGGVDRDGAALRYVESILKDCGWDGIEYSTGIDVFDGSFNASHIDPAPIRSGAAFCDDQYIINLKFFSDSLLYVWDNSTRPTHDFWKGEAKGRSYSTGHSFKIWDVDTAYRGPVEGYRTTRNDTAKNEELIEKPCPRIDLNWVAMPYNTIGASRHLSHEDSRMLRVKQWYEFCRNETLNDTSYGTWVYSS